MIEKKYFDKYCPIQGLKGKWIQCSVNAAKHDLSSKGNFEEILEEMKSGKEITTYSAKYRWRKEMSEVQNVGE